MSRLIETHYYQHSSEFRSVSDSTDRNAYYDEVGDGLSCQPEHWKTTNFVGNIIVIKD